MSTIIRDAIIRVKLDQQKISAESGSGKIAEGYKEVTRAAKESEVAQTKAAKAADAMAAGMKRLNAEWKQGGRGRDSWGEGLARMSAASSAATFKQIKLSEQLAAARRVKASSLADYAGGVQGHWSNISNSAEQSSQRMIASFREGGEGALRMVRGIAFLSANGSESLQKLVQKVAIAQGAFDVFAGGSKAITSLGAVFGGPVALGVAAATAAIAGGVVAWNRWERAAADAAKAQEEVRQAAIKFEHQQQGVWEKQQQRESHARRGRASGSSLVTEFALTPEDRLAALRAERGGLDAELKAAGQDRGRRLRGFRAEDFGGDAGEAFQNLKRFGSPAQLTNARDFEEQRSDIARRQLEIDRKLYDIQEKSIRESGEALQQRLSFGALPSLTPGIFGGPAAAVGIAGAGASFAEDNKKQLAELLTAQKAANAQMIAAFNDAQQKLAELRRQLEAANPQ